MLGQQGRVTLQGKFSPWHCSNERTINASMMLSVSMYCVTKKFEGVFHLDKMAMTILVLDQDVLGNIIASVPSGDWLPTAMVCKTLLSICLDFRCKRRDPVFNTVATSSLSRIHWAVSSMNFKPRSAHWLYGPAIRGDLKSIQFLYEYGCPLDVNTWVWALSNGHVDVIEYLYEHKCEVNACGQFFFERCKCHGESDLTNEEQARAQAREEE